MKKTDELLLNVVERYLLHRAYQSDNPLVSSIVKKLCEVELDEMWALTQNQHTA